MPMRAYGLLLAPAAFCLLAGLLGAGISILFIASPNQEDAEAGLVGLVASAVFLGLGGLFLLTAVAAARHSDRGRLWYSLFRWGIVAGVMVIPTRLLFGPSSGFHHHIGFGPFPFFYMVWNGEDPAPGSLQIVEGYEVWFAPVPFGVLLAIWAAVFAGAVALIHPTRPRES